MLKENRAQSNSRYLGHFQHAPHFTLAQQDTDCPQANTWTPLKFNVYRQIKDANHTKQSSNTQVKRLHSLKPVFGLVQLTNAPEQDASSQSVGKPDSRFSNKGRKKLALGPELANMQQCTQSHLSGKYKSKTEHCATHAFLQESLSKTEHCSTANMGENVYL